MHKIISPCSCGKPHHAQGLCGACYRKEHVNERKVYSANRYAMKKVSINARIDEYQKKKIKSDINFRLSKLLRNRVYIAIQNNQKVGSAVRDLGCSIDELKKHLESKFHPEWGWENYGRVWVIDHIKPLSSFKLEDREQFLEAVNYKNLQPLDRIKNLEKGALWQ
jgi:uncharacterized protein YxeA